MVLDATDSHQAYQGRRRLETLTVANSGIVRIYKLAFVIESSYPKCDFAEEPLSAPVKATFSF
jgi:hypothetical protein